MLNALNDIFSEPGAERRIDLMIGSHYDADHLKGLVPIIEDTSIEIAEAWMPPVADDASRSRFTSDPDTADMLGVILSNDEGSSALEKYLSYKREECETIFNMMEDIVQTPPRGATDSELRDKEFHVLRPFAKYRGFFTESDHDWFDKFLDDLNDNSTCCQTSRAIEEFLSSDDPEVFSRVHRFFSNYGSFGIELSDVNDKIARLSMLAKGPARDAINATSLAKVTSALKKRQIKTFYRTIDNGVPRYFNWDVRTKRFIGSAGASENGIVLTLLGPSERLVKKHQQRLPLMTYLNYAAYTSIPIDSITPSNQLSYIVKFTYQGQSILITGDAGCVDFNLKPRSREYYPNLLSEMSHYKLHTMVVIMVIFIAFYWRLALTKGKKPVPYCYLTLRTISIGPLRLFQNLLNSCAQGLTILLFSSLHDHYKIK